MMRAESEITQPIDRDELLGLLDTTRPDAEQRITTEVRVPTLEDAPAPMDLPPAGFAITFKTKVPPPVGRRYQTALFIAFSAAMFVVLGAAVALMQ